MTTEEADPPAHTGIKVLLWLYFWLLIWEGVLRKWVFPQWSDLLFVVRDPVVLLIYLLALRDGVFPFRPAILAIVVMAAAALALSLATNNLLLVTLFGVRTDFFHLPLVFIVEGVLDRRDVVRFGRWFLIFSVPIVLLMQQQFMADPMDWLNVGPGGFPGAQIRGALGKIRPPGPFTFVTGPVCFFAFTAAFSAYGWLKRGSYGWPLLILGTLALIVAIPISISRSLLLQVIIVALFSIPVVLLDLRRVLGAAVSMAVAAVAFSILANSIYMGAFSSRWEDSMGGSGYRGAFTRLLRDFTGPIATAAHAPWLGEGVGLGTIGGGHLETARYGFTLGESEWLRIVMELGPVLGCAFIAWRCWLAFGLLGGSWRTLRDQHDSLAWLLTGAVFLSVLNGQWGPSTQLGFAVFGAGLALAARNLPEAELEEDAPSG